MNIKDPTLALPVKGRELTFNFYSLKGTSLKMMGSFILGECSFAPSLYLKAEQSLLSNLNDIII